MSGTDSPNSDETEMLKVLAGLAAALAAVYGIDLLWSVGYGAWSLSGSGSGGIGAVSMGLFEAVMPLVISAVLNRILVRWVRGTGGVVLMLHRLQSIGLILVLLFALSSIVLVGLGVDLDVRLWITFGLMAGFALAAQSLLLSAVLACFTTRTRVTDV